MLVRLIGILSIAWGILWVARPEFLRRTLLRKTGRHLFWLAAGVFFFPLVHFFGKKAGAAGFILTAALFWIGMKMVRTTLKEFLYKIPLEAFRAAGVVNILTGCALLWWPRH